MKKVTFVTFGVFLLVTLAVGTAAGYWLDSQPAPGTVEDAAPPALAGLFGLEQPSLLELPQQTQDGPKADLQITSGEVFSCGVCEDDQDCELVFTLIEGDSLQVGEGAAVRTGREGGATLDFGGLVELTLAPNTQIRIRKYQTPDGGPAVLHIEQLIGEVFFQVNAPGSSGPEVDFKLITPITVAGPAPEAEAYSGVSTINYPDFAGLSPEALEEEIRSTVIFNNECGVLCLSEDCSACQQFAVLDEVTAILSANTGDLEVKYITRDGLMTAEVDAGETFTDKFRGFRSDGTWTLLCAVLSAIANGETPSASALQAIQNDLAGPAPAPPPAPSPSNCGDGVCDIYDNENSTTCPQDCN